MLRYFADESEIRVLPLVSQTRSDSAESRRCRFPRASAFIRTCCSCIFFVSASLTRVITARYLILANNAQGSLLNIIYRHSRQHRIRKVQQGRQKQAMQLNRIVIVAAAVTMPSARKYGKGRRYLGKRMALLAWKLDCRGTVVDEVVVLGSSVVGGSSGVYRRLRGEEIVNIKQS